MQKSALWFALGGMICLNACGDSDSTGASNYTERGGATVDSVKTVGNLGYCFEDFDGKVVFVQKTSTYYLCKDEDWIKMKLDEEELPSSSSKAKSSSSQKKSSSSKAKSSSSQKNSSSSKAKSSSSQKLSSSSVAKSSSSQVLSSSSVVKSSSSQEQSSSSVVVSSSSAQNSAFMSEVYDCGVYKCVTTDYLNKDMLDSGLYGQFLDVRDSQVYRTVTIGTQTWMAQNLNYKTELSECYGGENSNCEKYGRLYYQKEALNACPAGWHLPSNEEWDILGDYADSLKVGASGNGNSLKSLKTWTGQLGTDQFGFSGLASRYFGSVYICGGSHGVYWTSEEYEYRCLLSDRSDLYHYRETYSKDWGMSIRCILNSKDSTSSD